MTPAVIVVPFSPEELRELVTTAVRAAVAEIAPAATSAPLVDGKELARILGVSVATVRRLVLDGLPHVFVGQAPRFEAAVVRAWLEQRGSHATKAAPSKATSIAGVRLLSRGAR